MAEYVGQVPGFPDFDDFDDYEAHHEAEEARMDELRAEAADVSSDDDNLVGALVRWPRADGYAVYRVEAQDPITLSHVPYLDGYGVETALIRGLREQDIRDKLEQREKLDDALGR